MAQSAMQLVTVDIIRFSFQKFNEMKQNKFPLFAAISTLLLLVGITFVSSPGLVFALQSTETPAAATGLFITVVTTEPQINVRLGPSSTVYPIVGTLLTGSTVPAFGRSPGGDWIQIEFPSAPGGKGWVYSPLVQVSPIGSTLQVIEPPPTPVPPATSTIDPTLAAQFVFQPTSTRLPTYTPAPTRTAVEFEPPAESFMTVPWAAIIIAFAVLGVIGFLLSLIRR